MAATWVLCLGLALLAGQSLALPRFFYDPSLGYTAVGYSDCAAHIQPWEVISTLPNGQTPRHLVLRPEKDTEQTLIIVKAANDKVVGAICPGYTHTITFKFGGNTRRGALFSTNVGQFVNATPGCPNRVDASGKFRGYSWDVQFSVPVGTPGNVVFRMTSSIGKEWMTQNWTVPIDASCDPSTGVGAFPTPDPGYGTAPPKAPPKPKAPSKNSPSPSAYGGYGQPDAPPPPPREPRAPRAPRSPRMPSPVPSPPVPSPTNCWSWGYGMHYGYGYTYGYGYNGNYGYPSYGYGYGLSYGYGYGMGPCA